MIFPFFLSKYMGSLLTKQKWIKKNITRSDMDQSQHENLTTGCPNSKCAFSELFWRYIFSVLQFDRVLKSHELVKNTQENHYEVRNEEKSKSRRRKYTKNLKKQILFAKNRSKY